MEIDNVIIDIQEGEFCRGTDNYLFLKTEAHQARIYLNPLCQEIDDSGIALGYIPSNVKISVPREGLEPFRTLKDYLYSVKDILIEIAKGENPVLIEKFQINLQEAMTNGTIHTVWSVENWFGFDSPQEIIDNIALLGFENFVNVTINSAFFDGVILNQEEVEKFLTSQIKIGIAELTALLPDSKE